MLLFSRFARRRGQRSWVLFLVYYTVLFLELPFFPSLAMMSLKIMTPFKEPDKGVESFWSLFHRGFGLRFGVVGTDTGKSLLALALKSDRLVQNLWKV